MGGLDLHGLSIGGGVYGIHRIGWSDLGVGEGPETEEAQLQPPPQLRQEPKLIRRLGLSTVTDAGWSRAVMTRSLSARRWGNFGGVGELSNSVAQLGQLGAA